MFNSAAKNRKKRLEDKIKEFIVARLNLDMEPGEIGDDQPLFGEKEDSLHLESIEALELVTGIRNEFDIIVEEDIDPALLSTVRGIANFIRSNMPDLLDEYADYEVDW